MSPTDTARVIPPGPLGRLFSPANIIVASALCLAVVLAGWWLLSPPMSEGNGAAVMAMQPRPFSAAYLLPVFAMWSIMMVAMMVPSAAPMILLHARIDHGPSAARLGHTLLFGFAYLVVWTGFSAAAAGVQAALVESGLISPATLSVESRTLTAGLLLATAAYELTAVKRLCLDHCQSPLVFIHRNRRPGAAGAFRLGLIHGLYCLGCCWALMLLLFVGGVMNLVWVAGLGVVVIGEKLAPPQWQVSRYVAAGLLIAAVIVSVD